MKKVRVLILIILVVVIGVFALSQLLLDQDKTVITETIKLIPVDADLIVEIRDFHKLVDVLGKEPLYWNELKSFPQINSLDRNIRFIDSLSLSSDNINNVLSKGSLVISIHEIGKNKLGSLFMVSIPETVKRDNLVKEINSLVSPHNLIEREYENVKIFDLSSLAGKNYSYTISKGNFIMSENSLLVEDVIRQFELPVSILDDKDFKSIYRTAGEKELANIYVDLSNLKKILSPYLNPNIVKNSSAMSNYASWMELDLSFKESVISLNGFATYPDSTSCYLKHIVNQEELEPNFESVLPESTALYYSTSIENTKEFKKQRKFFLAEQKYPEYFDDKIDKIEEKIGLNIADFIYGLSNSQVCFAISNVNELDICQNAILIIGTESQSRAEKSISDFVRSYTERTSQDYNNYVEEINIDQSHKYPVYRFPLSNWASLLFGSLYDAVDAKYCTIIDNNIVFARDKSVLVKIINASLLNTTLDQSADYLEFKKNLSRKTQVNFYLDVNKSISWIISNLNKDSRKSIESYVEVLKKFHEFSFQQTLSDDMVYHNIVLQYKAYQKEIPHTVWESRVDTVIRMKPVVVRNHKTGEKEILVQDVSDNLYLLNKKGIVLWKIPLDEPIMGGVTQVDVYKNKKLQYLFNTKTKLYIIDRLGNHVERFPVNLRIEASAGVAVFDYDHSRNYRICVPCVDKNVYLYNVEGNIISGWEFKGCENPSTVSPQHFRDRTNDYIVFHDKYQLYILNRKGQSRVQPKMQFSASKQNKFWFTTKNDETKSSITCTNTKGVVYNVYLNGDVDTLFFHTFSENHFFMYRDLDSDGKNDYIFLDGKKLEVYSQNKHLMFEHKFKNNITDEPTFYVFSSSNHKLGVVDMESSKIYLFNSDGTMHQGFPLMGTSPFRISYIDNNAGHFNLFVGGKGNFLYNYEVK